jgi:hypothetical protein
MTLEVCIIANYIVAHKLAALGKRELQRGLTAATTASTASGKSYYYTQCCKAAMYSTTNLYCTGSLTGSLNWLGELNLSLSAGFSAVQQVVQRLCSSALVSEKLASESMHTLQRCRDQYRHVTL